MVLLGNLCGMLPEPLYARNYTKEQEVTARAKLRRRKKKNLLTTTMQYTLAKENHITVVVGCRKGQRHQCRPPMT